MNKQEIFTKLLTSNESNTEETIKIIKELSRYKDHIFRGENKNYGKVSSKLYRKHHGIIHDNFSVLKMQKALVESAKPHIRSDAPNIEVLTELQHYGGKTALIDFTTNTLIALFFACYGGFSENSRIIVLKNPERLPEDDIKDNDNSAYRIQPSVNPRANFQSSVFVQVATGYLEEGSYEVINIKQEHKTDYLGSLKQFFGIDADTVYNDIHGVIQNQDDHTIAETEFFTGNACFEDKDYDQAIEHYDNAIESNPNFTEAFYFRGVAYNNKGEYDLAIADFNKAIALNPDLAEAFNNRGDAYERKGKYDHAITDYSKAISLNPDLAEAFCGRGISYERKGEYKLAIVNYTQAIALKPDDAEAFYFRGVAYESKGKYKLAIADFNKAIALNPDFAEAFNNRGATYNNKGKYDLAIADFNKAIALRPDFAEAFCNRGLAYFEKGEYDQAIADYSKAIALKLDYAEAFYNRGLAYGSRGEDDLAIADLTQAIELLTQQGKMDLANTAKRLLKELKDQKFKTKTPNHDQQKPKDPKNPNKPKKLKKPKKPKRPKKSKKPKKPKKR